MLVVLFGGFWGGSRQRVRFSKALIELIPLGIYFRKKKFSCIDNMIATYTQVANQPIRLLQICAIRNLNSQEEDDSLNTGCGYLIIYVFIIYIFVYITHIFLFIWKVHDKYRLT